MNRMSRWYFRKQYIVQALRNAHTQFRWDHFSHLFCLMLALVMSVGPSLAETIVSGEVSGVWDTDGSPYLVTDTLIVPEGDTLLIEPGVTVEFQDQTDTLNYPLIVEGYLEAIGTEEDSIYFLSDGAAFKGILTREDAEGITIRLEYIVMEETRNGVENDGGVTVLRHIRMVSLYGCVETHSSVADTIEYCQFLPSDEHETGYIHVVLRSNFGSFFYQNNYGRKLSFSLDTTHGEVADICHNTALRIHASCETEVSFYDNVAILISVSSAMFQSGIFHVYDNDEPYPEGPYVGDFGNIIASDCEVEIDHNLCKTIQITNSTATIHHNHIEGDGQTQLAARYSIANVYDNLIVSENQCMLLMSIYEGNVWIMDNTLVFGTEGIMMNGLYDNDYWITNNLFFGDGANTTGVSLIGGNEPVSSAYNCFYGVTRISNGFEVEENNLFIDPCLAGGDPFDYHLQANSPCIDAGDPDSPDDPDGTRADIGCYYYNHTIDNPPVQTIPEEVFAQTGQLLRVRITATDDNGPFSFTFPDLPDWLTEEDELDWVSDTTVVSGTVPEDAEDFSFTVIVEDGEGQTDSSIVTVDVDQRNLLYGEISGVLHVADSPFYVVQDIIVPEGDSLVIEPGCELQFRYVEDAEQRIGLDIYGKLIAEGTQQDSIAFCSAIEEMARYSLWEGITIACQEDTSQLKFTIVADAYKAVMLDDTTVTKFCNSSFINNFTSISLYDNALAYIDNCKFVHTYQFSYHDISSHHSTIFMNNSVFESIIRNNNSEYIDISASRIYVNDSIFLNGGSCTVGNAHMYINNCIFNCMSRAAMYGTNAYGIVKNNLFYNIRERQSIGTFMYNTQITVVNNIYHGFEYAIYMSPYAEQDSLPIIENNIFLDNSYGIYFDNGIYEDIFMDRAQYNSFYQNDTLIINGELDSTNLFVDPLLEDTSGYYLYDISPLIDAGNPDSAYNDVNGSRNDIGRWGGPYGESYEYPLKVTEVLNEQPKDFKLYAPYPNPFNSVLTLHYSLPYSGDVHFTLCNILGQLVLGETWSAQQVGHYKYVLDASGLASGVYFLELATGKEVQQVKVVLLK